eukprot:CAMPEP_0171464626 /NCGR_PEP_ID=MMETSP0945-20130129/7891_1 /TAXON_ID=109269 /ORGANISM="Vaucheria litorea, Strain CCMP2940" /LENGTH=235 /DNA_ID=CAMNT_0011991795 /DNA_START=122 /DNA_END=826 /DNA_ORIENTATION=+
MKNRDLLSSSSTDYDGGRGYSILLVDDEPPLRKAVAKFLEQKGYVVETRESAMEALSYLRDDDASLPDLIISDITMPQMDGLQLLQHIKSFPSLRRIPVIFLTARGMTPDRIAGYRAGVNAYLPKPFDPEELMSIIDNLILNKQSGTSEIAEIRKELSDIKTILVSQNVGPKQSANEASDDLITNKEKAVLEFLCRGFTNKEIAEEMDTSIRNIEKHVTKLLNKTGTSNRTELVK